MTYDPAQQAPDDQSRKSDGILSDIGIIIAVLIAAGLGALVSGGEMDPWYVQINKSELTPPGFVFGLVWPALYFLMITSGIIVRHNTRRMQWAGMSFSFFFMQLTLNLAWSVMFFFFHKPLWALVDIVCLWVLITLMMGEFYKYSRWAAWLQVPYLIWITFATYLNVYIVLNN